MMAASVGLILTMLLIAAFNLGLFALAVYGIILSFKKHVGLGVASLFIPFFGLVVGAAQLFFKKDILESLLNYLRK